MEKITRRSALAAMGAATIIPAVAAPADPMLELITEYRKEIAVFAAIPEYDLTQENEPMHVAATYEEAENALMYATPKTTSLAGVREAIRMALQERGFCCTMSENVMRSALAHLDEVA